METTVGETGQPRFETHPKSTLERVVIKRLSPLFDARIISSWDLTEVAVTISGRLKISFLLELKFTLNNEDMLSISNQ